MGHAVAGTFEDKQTAIVDQADDHGGDHLLIGEYSAPLAELDVVVTIRLLLSYELEMTPDNIDLGHVEHVSLLLCLCLYLGKS